MRQDNVEEVLLSQAVALLPPAEGRNYASCRYTSKENVRAGSILVIWTQQDDKPVIVGYVIVRSVSLHFYTGMICTVTVHTAPDYRQHLMHIGHTPKEVYDRVFLSIPYYSDIIVTPSGGTHTIRFCLRVKAADSPTYDKEGKTSIASLSAFNAQFPGIWHEFKAGIKA